MWLNARFLVILEASIVVVGTLAVNSGLSVVLDFRASKLSDTGLCTAEGLSCP